MPRRKIQRTIEEEEEFQRRRCERKAENQHRRHQIAKIINNIPKSVNDKNHIICIAGTIDNRIIELNDNVEEQVVCTSGTIRDNRVMKLDNEIIE